MIFVLHAVILDLCRLAILDSFALLKLVQEHQIECLDNSTPCQSHKYAQHGAQTRVVGGRIRTVEKKGANDITG